jgi:hypothetical protein
MMMMNWSSRLPTLSSKETVTHTSFVYACHCSSNRMSGLRHGPLIWTLFERLSVSGSNCLLCE